MSNNYLDDIENEHYRKELRDIKSNKLRDFLGWSIFATDHININKKDVEYYCRKEGKDKYSAFLKVKGTALFAQGFTKENAEEELIKICALKFIKEIDKNTDNELTAEDIISLGFNLDHTLLFKKDGYSIVFGHNEWTEINNSREVLFKGYIKNKSELKTLLRQVR